MQNSWRSTQSSVPSCMQLSRTVSSRSDRTVTVQESVTEPESRLVASTSTYYYRIRYLQVAKHLIHALPKKQTYRRHRRFSIANSPQPWFDAARPLSIRDTWAREWAILFNIDSANAQRTWEGLPKQQVKILSSSFEPGTTSCESARNRQRPMYYRDNNYLGKRPTRFCETGNGTDP